MSRSTRPSSSFSPALSGMRVTHRWGGPLGIARDWHPSVGFDSATGLGWAGGYVGDGVAVANLAGRTLAALITGTDEDCTRLCWVGHRSPTLGVRAACAGSGSTPPYGQWHRPTEPRSDPGRASRLASALSPLIGGLRTAQSARTAFSSTESPSFKRSSEITRGGKRRTELS